MAEEEIKTVTDTRLADMIRQCADADNIPESIVWDEDILSCLRELRLRRTGWQPIETAPKDGTEVIVGVDIASVWITRGAFYVAPGERDTPDSVGWWSYKHSVTQEKLEGMYEPTHWLPMPETPSDRETLEIIQANR